MGNGNGRNNRLTQKQMGFVLDVVNEIPHGQAYMSHYKVKSMAVAYVCASQLLRTPKIQAYLQELRQKMEDESIASPIERRQILTEIARGRIGNLLDNNQRIKQGQSLTDASIQEVDTFDIKIGKGENAKLAEVTKIKLHNPITAIDTLNKMDKLYADGVNIDNRKQVINFDVRNLSTAQLEDIIARYGNLGIPTEEAGL